MRRVTTIAELRAHVQDLRLAGRTIGLVPTMGALHAGHLELVRRLAEHVDDVVVTIFVNPTQFDREDDLAAYPRDVALDEVALDGLGPATPTLLFTPSVAEMYPQEPWVRVVVGGGLADRLCGRSRPGHFDAVATVVTKFFEIVRPDVAAFGQKDRQQLQVVRRLVADLNLPVSVLGVTTVREADGVAMSSRNRRLVPAQRLQARALSRALAAAVIAARQARSAGEPLVVARLWEAASAALAEVSGVVLDYLEIVHPATMQPVEPVLDAEARMIVAIAAELGAVRLIDNVEVGDLDDEEALLVAVERGRSLERGGTLQQRRALGRTRREREG